MLEEKLEAVRLELAKNTAAVLANTAALTGGKAPAAAKGGEGKADAPAVKHTSAEVKAMATRVQKEIGTPEAKKLIKAQGVDDLAGLIAAKAKWPAFMAAAEKMFAPEEDGEAAADEDEDEL